MTRFTVSTMLRTVPSDCFDFNIWKTKSTFPSSRCTFISTLAWRQAAIHLDDRQPEAGWTPKRIEHLVERVHTRLSADGVPGLAREEVGEPTGNVLNHNLIRILMETTTMVPPDLRLLDHRTPGIGSPTDFAEHPSPQ